MNLFPLLVSRYRSLVIRTMQRDTDFVPSATTCSSRPLRFVGCATTYRTGLGTIAGRFPPRWFLCLMPTRTYHHLMPDLLSHHADPTVPWRRTGLPLCCLTGLIATLQHDTSSYHSATLPFTYLLPLTGEGTTYHMTHLYRSPRPLHMDAIFLWFPTADPGRNRRLRDNTIPGIHPALPPLPALACLETLTVADPAPSAPF